MANPLRLLNFVPESGEDIAAREPRPQDRPLFEILKENKDKKDAEFNERFRHRPPKALDDDETEFLEMVRTHQKDQEKLIADEEARELREFQAAIASRTLPSEELKADNVVKQENEKPAASKRPARPKIQAPVIKIVPQPKKPRVDARGLKDTGYAASASDQLTLSPPDPNLEDPKARGFGLVSYSDESDEE